MCMFTSFSNAFKFKLEGSIWSEMVELLMLFAQESILKWSEHNMRAPDHIRERIRRRHR